MKKRIISFFNMLVLVVICVCNTYASDIVAKAPHIQSEVRKINLAIDHNEDGIVPQADGYYYWSVDSKTSQGTVYGPWRLGPQGDGPGTISVNRSDTVTNTISGSYSSTSDIAAALGVSIGVSKSYAVSYSLPVPSGKTYQIKYRPLFTKYKVVQQQYHRIDGSSNPTGNKKICYVNVFYDWGFSYNVL